MQLSGKVPWVQSLVLKKKYVIFMYNMCCKYKFMQIKNLQSTSKSHQPHIKGSIVTWLMATISDSIVDYFHLYNSDGHAGKGVSERATGRLQYHWVFNNEFEKIQIGNQVTILGQWFPGNYLNLPKTSLQTLFYFYFKKKKTA